LRLTTALAGHARESGAQPDTETLTIIHVIYILPPLFFSKRKAETTFVEPDNAKIRRECLIAWACQKIPPCREHNGHGEKLKKSLWTPCALW